MNGRLADVVNAAESLVAKLFALQTVMLYFESSGLIQSFERIRDHTVTRDTNIIGTLTGHMSMIKLGLKS